MFLWISFHAESETLFIYLLRIKIDRLIGYDEESNTVYTQFDDESPRAWDRRDLYEDW